jgi:hypothetical protein
MTEDTKIPASPITPALPPRMSILAARRAAAQKLNMVPPAWAPIPNPTPANPKKHYSATVRGFFSEEIHGANLPVDAVEITTDEWQALLAAQTSGKQIVPGPDGKPIAVDPIITPAMKRRRIEAQIQKLRTAPDTLDAQRGVLLGKTGAKEALQAIDNQMAALQATLPPLELATDPATP